MQPRKATDESMSSNMYSFHNGSISSQSTHTSSIFSNEEEDYDSRIREIEEYYVKTLLNEDSSSEPVSKPQQQYTPQFSFNDFRDSFGQVQSTVPHQPQQQQQQQQQPLQYTGVSREKPKEDSLEVEINSQYRPTNGTLPLTSENLELLQKPSLVQALPPPPCYESVTPATNNPSPAAATQPVSNEKVNRSLYKTELCESFTTKGYCKYGNKCQFAHGLQELKFKERNNKFRTKPCVNWSKTGYCRYGKRCCFKHGDDEDIQVYVQAATVFKKPGELDESPRKNTHADVKALQKITW